MFNKSEFNQLSEIGEDGIASYNTGFFPCDAGTKGKCYSDFLLVGR